MYFVYFFVVFFYIKIYSLVEFKLSVGKNVKCVAETLKGTRVRIVCFVNLVNTEDTHTSWTSLVKENMELAEPSRKSPN